MAQIPSIPSLPGLPTGPVRTTLQGFSPRLMPRLIPRYKTQAARIGYHVDAMGSTPAADLKLTFITGLTGPEGKDTEYYAFMRGADIEGFMSVTPVDSKHRFYVARMHDAAGHIALDGKKVVDFPEAGGAFQAFLGYAGFDA